MHRRDFLTRAALLGTATTLRGQPSEGWATVPAILARIRPPAFPKRDFDVRRYGAAGDGKTDCRPAIAKAIAECHASGGGRVVVSAGDWLCNGPIHLAANVNLQLVEGSTLRFGTNPADYLPAVLVRWEGTRCRNYSPLVYAYRQDNIAITGRGTLDGQASRFWHEWKRKQTPDQEALRKIGMERSLSISGSSAPATTSAPACSSPTIAATSSSKASPSKTARSGPCTPFFAAM